MSFSVSTRWVL